MRRSPSAANDLVERDGAEVVVLAGAVMAGLPPLIQDLVLCPLVEGIASGVGLAELLVRLGPARARTGSVAPTGDRAVSGLFPELTSLLTRKTMSRAFVKEDDVNAGVVPLPDRLISPHRNLVTRRGLHLIDRQIAQHQQDFSGATTAADREAVARASRELRYWTARRATAEVAEPGPDVDSVVFGTAVTLLREDGTRLTLRIVGEDEADPASGRIAWTAPVARALLGASPDDVRELPTGSVGGSGDRRRARAARLSAMSFRHIVHEQQDGVAQIVLNRPAQANALNQTMLGELNDALDAAEQDAGCPRRGSCGAAGNAFSSGFDLKEQMERRPDRRGRNG